MAQPVMRTSHLLSAQTARRSRTGPGQGAPMPCFGNLPSIHCSPVQRGGGPGVAIIVFSAVKRIESRLTAVHPRTTAWDAEQRRTTTTTERPDPVQGPGRVSQNQRTERTPLVPGPGTSRFQADTTRPAGHSRVSPSSSVQSDDCVQRVGQDDHICGATKGGSI